MPAKKTPPSDCDLTRTCTEIARETGVGRLTAGGWKKAAGLPGQAGRPKNANWTLVTDADWRLGSRHVARVVGINVSAAWNYGKKYGLLDPARSKTGG